MPLKQAELASTCVYRTVQAPDPYHVLTKPKLPTNSESKHSLGTRHNNLQHNRRTDKPTPMASNARASNANGTQAAEPPKSYYEQQRELLIIEIAQSLNTALHNLNHLNRSLEEVIQVGNEFAPVESLWSHFESVMGDGHQPSSADADKDGKSDGEGEVEEGASESS
ncbi:Dolichyl-diphosphooligosaccharide-protein glycosyltransferase subunit dad1 [Kalmusia sp. IMI 367209]|nr:Dolichyl-diphosphooligosaccharide-protein glycosyltransferase subunit dad1 [Kalmusia sp. IMI 367209]